MTYSIAHEVGHIIGARHDIALDKNATPFPYGHGFLNGTKWRDIMSYKASCDGCPRVPIWSNPAIKFKGDPAGTVDADNARVILEQAERVRYRTFEERTSFVSSSGTGVSVGKLGRLVKVLLLKSLLHDQHLPVWGH